MDLLSIDEVIVNSNLTKVRPLEFMRPHLNCVHILLNIDDNDFKTVTIMKVCNGY